MLKKALNLILLFIIISCSPPKFKSYKKGYLVSFQKDTLHGEVKPGVYRLKLKYPHVNGVQKYKYDHIWGYKHGDEINVKLGEHFYTRLVKGYMSLYTRTTRKTYGGGMEGSYSIIRKHYYARREDEEELTELFVTSDPDKNDVYFRQTVLKYFSDNRDFVEAVYKGKYNTRNIKQLVEDYNSWYHSQQQETRNPDK